METFPTSLKLLSAFLVLLLVNVAHAQTPLSSPIPSHLEPIERAPGSSILGVSYFYKGRRLSSPFSVEVPIRELNDPIANRHFRRFRAWNTAGRLTGLASIAYVLFTRTSDPQTRRAVYVVSLVASVGFSLLSNRQVNKAVRQYNTVIGAPRVGFILVPTFGNTLAGGINVTFPVFNGEH